MREVRRLDASILNSFPLADEQKIEALLVDELERFQQKIVVLDDDPTGIQTVQDVSVYTGWDEKSIEQGFLEQERLFFLLTNSRSFTASHTREVHQEIAANLCEVYRRIGKDFVVISRGDSTLRGHYPLETQTLREGLEAGMGLRFDGEIILPFFLEGGRYTIDNIHYVREGDELIPAGMTEFAKDKTFGYRASDLCDWCEEKTEGAFRASELCRIPLEALRTVDVDTVEALLMKVTNFGKVIVNAVDYCDVKVFAIAYLRALAKGKRFLFRAAAAITKVLGGVPDRPPLTRTELICKENRNGGIVLVGSHVNKTTRQLGELQKSRCPMEFIQFDQHLVLKEGGLAEEIQRVGALAEEAIRMGRSAVVYTRRERLDLDTADSEKQLLISVQISDAVVNVVKRLSIQPSFVIAKGGITSSDVGTKALQVKKARVMGQISPGIPVWMTGSESKFPGMPYVIFPGNVGKDTTLREVVETLMG